MSRIPPTVIREIPPTVIRTIEPLAPPVTQRVPPPVTNGIKPPVINVPEVEIDYPTIDVPTQEEWEGVIGGQQNGVEQPTTPGRDLPPTPATPQVPTINIGGTDVPMPDVAPLITAGASAVVATTVTLGATIAFQQLKTAADPLIKRMTAPKKKKIKIKQVKPVLHFIPNDDGTTEVIQYSARGMKVLEGGIEKLEQYLRDQVEIDALWEYDNKIIIDKELSKQLTKEGQNRFKKYFVSPKAIAKKLGAKFSF